jgi:integrase
VRPPAAGEHLLLSLPRTGQPPRALTTRHVVRIVAGYAQAAGLPEDRRIPRVLRHTFGTHLADAGADVGTIRELAGHADVRTTTIYTAVSDARLEQAIAERSGRRGVHRVAPGSSCRVGGVIQGYRRGRCQRQTGTTVRARR